MSMMPFTVGERIHQARRMAGLSQGQLGAQLGVTKMAVSLWERDKRRLGSEQLGNLADALGVKVSFFHYQGPRVILTPTH